MIVDNNGDPCISRIADVVSSWNLHQYVLLTFEIEYTLFYIYKRSCYKEISFKNRKNLIKC